MAKASLTVLVTARGGLSRALTAATEPQSGYPSLLIQYLSKYQYEASTLFEYTPERRQMRPARACLPGSCWLLAFDNHVSPLILPPKPVHFWWQGILSSAV
ncbi:hypothetical protein OH76DRAFT_35561 [Lentinus brumalis]|uniref:Uncharacterized protein n=1 Tax=Lentinus brumalis TaxID=2498619 RepID=A0A371DY24_9APHY|nr:hypothetical protein OH76DRAFT_35561 [Polyporus brumalis]